MSAEQSESRPLRVVVVDDDRDTADSVVALLQLHGYEAFACYDAPRALPMISSVLPHVCVVDLWMPGMSGFDLVRWLRSMSLSQRPCLVAFSGVGGPGLRERTAEAGFDAYVQKPADLNQILAAVEQACKLRMPSSGTPPTAH